MKKRNDAIRIVVLGDSVTFGQGVKYEETFPKVLEMSLNKKFHQNYIEVINFGVQAYTVKNQVARFILEARQFQPDIAILSPIVDDLNLNREINLVDEEGFLTKKGYVNLKYKKYFRRFHVAYIIKNFIYRNYVIHSRHYQKNKLSSNNLRERLDLLDREVNKFLSTCKKDNIIPVFALLDLQSNLFTNAIITRLRQKFPNLIVIDCSLLFRNDKLAQFKVPNDGHPNGKAHKIIAKALEGKLIQIIQNSIDLIH